jgi:hypothetical protein
MQKKESHFEQMARLLCPENSQDLLSKKQVEVTLKKNVKTTTRSQLKTKGK